MKEQKNQNTFHTVYPYSMINIFLSMVWIIVVLVMFSINNILDNKNNIIVWLYIFVLGVLITSFVIIVVDFRKTKLLFISEQKLEYNQRTINITDIEEIRIYKNYIEIRKNNGNIFNKIIRFRPKVLSEVEIIKDMILILAENQGIKTILR